MSRDRRILAVNPNTSPAVTARFVDEARRSLPPGVALDAVTGRFGAEIVSTRAENLVAAHSALELVARHAGGYDAIVLAISFDTALAALADLLPVPVVGITGAAVAAARRVGRVGIVTFGDSARPLYLDVLAGYGVAPAEVETVELATVAGYLDGGLDDAAAAAAGRLAARGAEAVVVTGTAVVGIAERLAPRLAVPVFDGAAPSIAAALAGIGSGAAGAPVRPLARSTGLDPDLARFLGGGPPASLTPPNR